MVLSHIPNGNIISLPSTLHNWEKSTRSRLSSHREEYSVSVQNISAIIQPKYEYNNGCPSDKSTCWDSYYSRNTLVVLPWTLHWSYHEQKNTKRSQFFLQQSNYFTTTDLRQTWWRGNFNFHMAKIQQKAWSRNGCLHWTPWCIGGLERPHSEYSSTATIFAYSLRWTLWSENA